jgi:hypothetical protein
MSRPIVSGPDRGGLSRPPSQPIAPAAVQLQATRMRAQADTAGVALVEHPARNAAAPRRADDEGRRRVLVVAYRTVATPSLIAAVRVRARQRPCEFTLLVPAPYSNPDTEEAEKIIELAVPLLEEAAGAHVDAVVGETDPIAAVRRALEEDGFDEVIVSTPPRRISR